MSFHDDTAARLPPSAADALAYIVDAWVKERAALVMKNRIDNGTFVSDWTEEAKLAWAIDFVKDINKVFKKPWQKTSK